MDGKKLKEKIDKLGWTQRKLSEAMEVTPQTISAILTAKDVRTSTIERIASVTNCPVSYFFDDGKSIVASGNGNVNVAGNNNSTAVGSKESEKDETVAFLREIIKNLFSQIDRLNGEIETLRDVIDFYKMENLQNQAKK